MDEKNIEEKLRINSPKLKVEKTFESNYEKDKEVLKYSIKRCIRYSRCR